MIEEEEERDRDFIPTSVHWTGLQHGQPVEDHLLYLDTL